MSTLTIVRGLPGSGKSTFAKSLGCFHLESDMYFINDGQYEWSGNKVKSAHEFTAKIAEQICLTNADLVVSNTFTQSWEFQKYIDLAKKYNYNLVIHRFNSQYGNVHNVPKESLDKMKNRFEDFKGEIIHE
jgi:predicted kinase